MLILDSTLRSIEVKLGGTVTTNQLPVVTSYVDWNGSTYVPGSSNTVTNNTTAVTAVAAPGASTQRQVKQIVIFNADTVAATVIIQYNDNTTIRQLVSFTLAVGDVIVYSDGEGFRVLDSTGQLKGAGGGGGGESNTASNVGTGGVGVFKQKTGVDLEFKNINAGSSKITITDDTGNNEVDVDVAEANISHANIGGKTANDHHNQSHDHSAAGDGQTLSPATLNLPSTVTPAQTAEGQMVWDSDDDLLTVGNGTGRETFLPVDDAVSNPADVTTASPADGTEPTVARKDHVHGLANGAATYAKIQNVSSTSRILGRKTAGAGVIEELTTSEVLDFLSSTRGAVLYRGASGWAGLAPGTSGHVLTSNGAGADPSYQAGGGSGSAFTRDRSVQYFVDDFMTIQSESGEVGEVGWSLTLATVTGGGRVVEHPGILQLQTPSTINSKCYITSAALSNTSHSSEDDFDMYVILRTPDISDLDLRIGLFFGTGDPPANGMYFEYISSSDTNWQFITRSSSTETQNDSGVALATNSWYRLRVRRTGASQISFSINDGTETNHTTNIPSDVGAISIQIINRVGSSKSIDIDYVDYYTTGLTR